MAKQLDLNRSVFELAQEYPELIEIMANLGFSEITKKPVLHSVGKIMTISKGAKMKGIPMGKILDAFHAHDFEVIGENSPEEKKEQQEAEAAPSDKATSPESRTEQLKAYLRRLGAGEDLESVRADFVAHFRDVEASEIMKAEQELIQEGTPLSEVQKLCDIHSALFHGTTKEEQIANAEKAVEESLQKEKLAEAMKKVQALQENPPQVNYADKNARAAALAAIPGHPLYTFTKENEALTPLLKDVLEKLAQGADINDEMVTLRQLSIHYAKKGDLLYPHLKVKYGISGPSDVMWTVDDEIRDEMGALVKETHHDAAWKERAQAVLKRADEMIYKEQNILFPICAVWFTEEEWYGIYRDSKDYALCFGVENGVWEAAEAKQTVQENAAAGEIVMPGGHMTLEQLTALLNTLPIEITFVDADNINRFFNEGPKVFKRPGMAIDREVFSCHPPKIEAMVRAIINDFRVGRRDIVPVWMEKGGRSMLVRYMAVRDAQRNYLGTVEVVEDMEAAKAHFTKEE
ncbi:MAG: DUF438 domain-containing protein [Clostridia bacterium]|nr:DUF438 domain-containing protein [Clostridia bacterium]